MNRFEQPWNFDAEQSLFHPWEDLLDSNCYFSPEPHLSLPPLQPQIPPELQLPSNFQKLPDVADLTEEPFSRPTSQALSQAQPKISSKAHQLKKESRQRRKKNVKPSPYHNFQKHLNSTMKQILVVPPVSSSSSIPHQIAQQLWNVFTSNDKSTKKMLHFIFNEFNEYLIKERQLEQTGFIDIYRRHSWEDLAQAKNFLTQLALDQLNHDSLDDYLETRRIKNPNKFKKYIFQFRHQLQDRFIKKRFTNRSRKEQIKKLINKQQQN